MNAMNDTFDEETEDAPQPSGSRLVIWLVIFSLAALFLPLFLISTSIQEENQQLEATVTAIQATLVYTPEPAAQEQALQDALLQVRGTVNDLQPIMDGLANAQIDWMNAFAVISQYDTTRITLTGLTQTENRLVLNGQAINEDDVMGYFQTLDESLVFERVVVQSITLKNSSAITAKPTIRDATSTAVPDDRMTEFNILVELKVGA
ncbi:MAG: PilN domain-containing protein [Anaerolineaceae bacterium]|nr:PilN domain-containing protein [Anaerolineaceae bacterium]